MTPKHHTLRLVLAFAALLCFACGESDSDNTNTSSNDTSASTSGADATTDNTSSDAPSATDTSPDAQPIPSTPSALKTYAGTCPSMTTGTVQISSAGKDRRVELFLPSQPKGAPVLFLYHGAGDNAPSFANNFDAQGISAAFGAIVVVPYATGEFSFEWPILADDDENVDLSLFDDMLSCLDTAHDIDTDRIYDAGFSAGALWSGLLLSRRSDYLAAVTSFSGGIQDRLGLYQFQDPVRPLPVLCTHGGPDDQVLVKFQEATEKLASRLRENGSLVVLCTHTLGHTITNELYEAGLNFVFEHRFSAQSPFESGLGSGWPETCEKIP